MVREVGFEPTQPEATDLQSAPTLQLRRSPIMVGRLGLEPRLCRL